MPRTTRDVLREWHPHLTSIPSRTNAFVCDTCLGPVNPNFAHCFGCNRVFGPFGAPRELREAIVPMTSALKPSAWYTALINYKKYQPVLRGLIVSIAHHFLASRRTHIAALLGGEPTMITVVPSKKGVPYETQPLRTALAISQPIREKLAQALTYNAAEPVPHLGYNPAAFPVGPASARGHRIALIEDSCVSGATAISAAGALLEHGAASVAVLSIARVVAEDFWPEDHPYRIAMKTPFDADTASWPR